MPKLIFRNNDDWEQRQLILDAARDLGSVTFKRDGEFEVELKTSEDVYLFGLACGEAIMSKTKPPKPKRAVRLRD